MTIKATRIVANKGSFGRGVDIYLVNEDFERTAVGEPFIVNMVEDDGATLRTPTMTLDNKTAQLFMDALWECGIRPNNGEGMGAQVAAIKYHLEDMRSLVFKKESNDG